MKVIIRKLLIVSIVFISLFLEAYTLVVEYNTFTPDRFAKELVEVLKQQQVEEYKLFYPTLEDFKKTISSKVDTTTSQWYRIEASMNNDHAAEFQKYYDQYQSVIAKGKEMGIDWAKVKYDTIAYIEIKSGDYGIQVIPSAQIKFSYNQKRFYIEATRIPQLNIGWRGGNIRGPYLVQ